MDNSDLMRMKNEMSPERDRGRERERSRRGDRPSRFSSNTRDRSPVKDRRSKPNDRKVYVSNVAYESKWQDIKDLFRSEVGEVSYVELFVDDNDKPKGCGIVEFETAELAAKAVEKMHRYDLKGRKLVVKEASTVKDPDIDREKYGRQAGGRSGGRSESNSNSRRDDHPRSNTWDGNNQLSAMNASSSAAGPAGGNSNQKFGNTYGLSSSFLESLWVNGPLVPKVFVANLDYKVDEKKLREVFRLAGKVVHAEINVDKEGKSRGHGVVEYDHPVEAVQAISLLHNQMLFDRRLTVRMDRVDKADGAPKLPDGLKGIGMGLGVNGTILNDVARNLPPTNSTPLVGLASNVQQLQAAAAAAQAQVQLAQGAQLGQATLNAVNQGPLAVHLAGSNTLAPNLSSVLGGPSGINVSDLANLNASQAFGGSNQGLGSGMPSLAGLNAGMTAGLGVGGSGGMNQNFNSMNNQNSMMGGNSNSFNNSGSGLHSPGSGFGQTRDFDSMSAALSGNNSGGYGGFDRDNFRGGNNMRENNYNGSSRGVGNGRGSIGSNLPPSGSNTRGAVVVKNLPPNTSWQHLVEKFRDMGDIVNVEMIGKDAGIITFKAEWEAERAVSSLDRTRYEGRTIDVRLY